MKITDISVKRPVTTVVIYLALIVLGVFSLGRLAIDLIPDISFPVVVIYSTYKGAAPEEVEQNLTRAIENTAASASNIENIRSTSSEGLSFVIVEYQWGTDMGDAANELFIQESNVPVPFSRFLSRLTSRLSQTPERSMSQRQSSCVALLAIYSRRKETSAASVTTSSKQSASSRRSQARSRRACT